MNISVYSRSKDRTEVIAWFSKFYARKLNLDKSRYHLHIHTITDLQKNYDSNGLVSGTDAKEITMLLDSRLPLTKLMVTLAHEMVHVKQIAKGQYKWKVAKNGKTIRYWMGKKINTEYLKRPWEIEAFARESLLVEMLARRVLNRMKKVDKNIG